MTFTDDELLLISAAISKKIQAIVEGSYGDPDPRLKHYVALHEKIGPAVRDIWQRKTVEAAGHSTDTHIAKFDGTVLPRD